MHTLESCVKTAVVETSSSVDLMSVEGQALNAQQCWHQWYIHSSLPTSHRRCHIKHTSIVISLTQNDSVGALGLSTHGKNYVHEYTSKSLCFAIFFTKTLFCVLVQVLSSEALFWPKIHIIYRLGSTWTHSLRPYLWPEKRVWIKEKGNDRGRNEKKGVKKRRKK